VIAKELYTKLIEFPSKKHALNVIGLLAGLSAATWIAPNTAGTILLVQTVSGLGFVYNRGTPEVLAPPAAYAGGNPRLTRPHCLPSFA